MHFFKNHHQVREEEHDFSKGSVAGIILRLALPLIVAQFINVLYNIVDRIYIGRIPGASSAALTGVGVAFPVITAITAFSNLVGTGGPPLCSIARGKGDEERAEGIMGTSFTITLITGGILILVGMAVKEPLLYALGASDATFGYADDYISIYLLGTVFVMISLSMNGFINCQGFARTGMFTVLIGAVINIVLDPVFIFGFHMNVAGAAIATVIAQFVSCAFAFRFLIGKRIPVKITLLRKKNFSPVIVQRILALGVSPFLILATDSVILIVLNTVLQTYGGPEEGDLLITCATIVQSYMMLITGPMLGISSGTQAILSYNYGAKNIDRVKSAEKYILLLCLCFTTIMFLVSRTIPEYFIRIFTRDPGQTDLCVWGIQVFTLMIIPLSFQYVFVDGFTALGRSRTALFLSVFRKGDYMLFTMVLPIFFGARSAFYAQPLADGIGAVMSSIAFLLIFKKHLEKRMLA